MNLAGRHSRLEWVNVCFQCDYFITSVYVQGQEMPTKKLAKRAAALETCKRLHKLGELNEHLLPVDHDDPKEACGELFPLYKEETEEDVPQRGSGKRKQQYKKEVCSQFCPPLV